MDLHAASMISRARDTFQSLGLGALGPLHPVFHGQALSRDPALTGLAIMDGGVRKSDDVDDSDERDDESGDDEYARDEGKEMPDFWYEYLSKRSPQ